MFKLMESTTYSRMTCQKKQMAHYSIVKLPHDDVILNAIFILNLMRLDVGKTELVSDFLYRPYSDTFSERCFTYRSVGATYLRRVYRRLGCRAIMVTF